MEISLARKISVVIAARYDDLNAVKRIEKLKINLSLLLFIMDIPINKYRKSLMACIWE